MWKFPSPKPGMFASQTSFKLPSRRLTIRPERFTGVQGHTLFTHSFSRTCPVILSHSKSKHSIKGLAIIEDHSTLSFVVPSIPKELSIPQEDLTPETHSTVTVHGIQIHESITIKCLLITPLNGDPSIPLDSVRTMPFPDVRNDVPSPQEVL